MQITLKNIGIIKDSTIKLDGLTVVTGKNNSGKTTVGKTLYALIDGTSNIRNRAQRDKTFYIRRQLDNVASTLDSMRYFRNAAYHEDCDSILHDYPALNFFVYHTYRREILPEALEEFIRDLASDLERFDVNLLLKSSAFANYQDFTYNHSKIPSENTFIENFEQQRDRSITIINEILDAIHKDPDLIDYTRACINQTLRIEFSDQIQPIKGNAKVSFIDLTDNDNAYFHIEIEDNNILNKGIPVVLSSPFEKAFFIDNPFILDETLEMIIRQSYKSIPSYDFDSWLNPNRVPSHNARLKSTLRRKANITVFEQTMLANKLDTIKEKLSRILPGDFDFSDDGDYYIQDGHKLCISNLATGSKMFSIIKVLLDNGEINESTMLVLDEPESHLHPQWQNAFAEIIVLLVKELGVNILLTTHSPNFMLAIDAYMRKYSISDKTNFYRTDMLKDGFVDYQCVNDDMGQIYQDFLQYLSEVKMLRNKYLYNMED